MIYDVKSKRYIDDKGNPIDPQIIRSLIDKLSKDAKRDARLLSEQLASGKINLPSWLIGMSEIVKSGNIIAATVGKGGRERMTASDWGILGNKIKSQYGFLNKFGRNIEQGKIPLSLVSSRAQKYVSSFLVSYYKTLLGESEGKVRRILNAKESCVECEAVAAEGFMPIDEMPEIGSLLCGQFCLCALEFEDIYPMMSLDEAAEKANEIGIKELEFGEDYNNRLQLATDYIVNGLAEMVKRFPEVGMPEKVVFLQSEVNELNAWYSAKTKYFYVNLKSKIWNDVEYWMMEYGAGGQQATTNKFHVAWHEYAHYYHDKLNPDSMVKIALPAEEKLLIAKEVSWYAIRDSAEFIAEVWTGLVNGKDYSNDIILLYNKYGGIDPR